MQSFDSPFFVPRAQGLRELFEWMELPLEGITISYNGQQFIIHADSEAHQSAFLNAFQHFRSEQHLSTLEEVSFFSLIENEIRQYVIALQYIEACIALFRVAKSELTISVDPFKKICEINFPPEIRELLVSAFELLNFKFLRLENGKLIFDIAAYAKENPQHILQFPEASAEETTKYSLFFNVETMEEKTGYFATKPMEEGTFNVRPIILSKPQSPPSYYVFLDTSWSMHGYGIQEARKSFYRLASILFEVSPHAKLYVRVFSSKIKILREEPYTRETLSDLKEDLDQIEAGGQTALHEVALSIMTDYLHKEEGATPSNTFIFTDGENTGSPEISTTLSKFVEDTEKQSPGNDTVTQRLTIHKVSIIYCTTRKDPLIDRVVQLFNASSIDTSNFMFTKDIKVTTFLSDHFFRVRDLLHIRRTITKPNGENSLRAPTEEYTTRSVEQGGQFFALDPVILSREEELHLDIEDSQGQLFFHGEYTPSAPPCAYSQISAAASSVSNPLTSLQLSALMLLRTLFSSSLTLPKISPPLDLETPMISSPTMAQTALIPISPSPAPATIVITHDLVGTDAKTGLPLFKVFLHDGAGQPLGAGVLEQHPLPCHRVSGGHNILKGNGLFNFFQQNPEALPDTCDELPSSSMDTSLILHPGVQGGVHGFLKGSMDVLQKKLIQQGCDAKATSWIVYSIDVTLRSLFSLFTTYMMEGNFLLATITFVATEIFLRSLSYQLNTLTHRFAQAGHSSTARFTNVLNQWGTKAMLYMEAVRAQGPLGMLISVVAGIHAQAMVEPMLSLPEATPRASLSFQP